MAEGQPPEVLLCDTTFVSVQEAAEKNPEATAHWPGDVLSRIDSAVLAVSVFTLAEIRAGRIAANWGQRRSERQERLLAAFVTVPLDEDILNEYATLHAWGSRGHRTPHNDMWIAATAISRGFPLVSCDEHFEETDYPPPQYPTRRAARLAPPRRQCRAFVVSPCQQSVR